MWVKSPKTVVPFVFDRPSFGSIEKFIQRFAENLMIFSRQDEYEHLIRAKIQSSEKLISINNSMVRIDFSHLFNPATGYWAVPYYIYLYRTLD